VADEKVKIRKMIGGGWAVWSGSNMLAVFGTWELARDTANWLARTRFEAKVDHAFKTLEESRGLQRRQ
jgi:hypothetical protein